MRIKVIHLQTGVSEGSVVYWLNHGLNSVGVSSNIFCVYNKTNEEYIKLPFIYRFLCKVYYYIEQIFFKIIKPKNTIHHSLGFSLIPFFIIDKFVSDADIIHIHWCAGGFLSYNHIKKLSEKYKVIITHHDAFHFCGSEHHYYKNVNVAQGKIESKLNYILFNYKKKLGFINECLNIFPSSWLYSDAISRIENIKIKAILPNAFGSELFSSEYIKKDFKNINITIGLGSVNLYKNTLKGGELILNLLKLIDYSNKFDGTNIKVVVFGIHDPDIFKKEVSFKFTNIEFDIYGYINSKRDLSLIYKKIDFFVHFSKIENLSTVILESITAGCIPICFNVGGNKDILINEYNEFLINPFDVKSAFKKILTTQDNSVVKYNLSNFKGDFNDRATCLEHKKTYEEYLND